MLNVYNSVFQNYTFFKLVHMYYNLYCLLFGYGSSHNLAEAASTTVHIRWTLSIRENTLHRPTAFTVTASGRLNSTDGHLKNRCRPLSTCFRPAMVSSGRGHPEEEENNWTAQTNGMLSTRTASCRRTGVRPARDSGRTNHRRPTRRVPRPSPPVSVPRACRRVGVTSRTTTVCLWTRILLGARPPTSVHSQRWYHRCPCRTNTTIEWRPLLGPRRPRSCRPNG